MRGALGRRSTTVIATVAVLAASGLALPAPSTARATTPATDGAGTFVAVPSTPVLDTATGVGAPSAPVAGNAALSVTVAGRAGIPATGVGSVVLNVRVSSAASLGELFVYPTGTTRTTSLEPVTPAVSNHNLTVVRLGSAGSVSFFNGSVGTAQLEADVQGYYTAGTATGAGAFVPVTSARVLDTAAGVGRAPGPVTAGGGATADIAGKHGVPTTGVGAVVLNIRNSSATASGQLYAYPSGGRRTESAEPVAVGTTNHTLDVVQLGPTGKVGLYNSSPGTVDVVVDVLGYFLSGTPSQTGTFVTVTPTRVLDTSASVGVPKAPAAGHHALDVTVTGVAGMPAGGVSAVVVNVQVAATADGFVDVYPTGSTRPAGLAPLTRNSSAHALAMTAVSPGGLISVFNDSAKSASVVVDVVGYVIGPGSLPAAGTQASLGVQNGDTHVGDQVSFVTSASTIDPARTYGAGTLSFGDGTSVAVSSLAATPSHAYAGAGVYEATLQIVDSAGGAAVASQPVVIAAADSVVYRTTTRRVGASTVSSVTAVDADHVSVVLVPGTAAPPTGSTLVVDPGGIAPQGAALVVESAVVGADRSVVVSGRNAALSDVYSTLQVARRTSVGSTFGVVNTRTGRPAAAGAVPSSAVPFSCHRDGSDNRPLSVTADFSKTQIEPTIDLRDKIFQLIIIAKPTFTLSASFRGGVKCGLGDYFALNIPVPSVPGLVVTLNPYFDLEASGSVAADFTWSPTFILNVTRSSYSQTFLSMASRTTASASGDATLSLEGGLQLTVSLGRSAGIQAQLGPKISVSASLDTSSGGQACVHVTSAVEATVKLFAHVFFVNADLVLFHGEYYKTVLLDRCSPLASSGGTVSGGGSSGNSGGSPTGGTFGPTGPPDLSASNNNGNMAVDLDNFPLGTTYYFCHTGDPSAYPRGGTVTQHGQFVLTSYAASFRTGLCAGSGNSWIGLQATDGNDYYSNQVNLVYLAPTVTASNNNGQMALQLANFPLGTAYYFCHAGDPSTFPTGGTVTSHGQFNVTSPSTAFFSGVCGGSGNTWIGLQAPDGNDYYGNVVDLVHVSPTVTATNNNGQMAVALGSFPLGTTYYFCHSGVPTDFPTGGVITGRGRLDVSDPAQSWSSGLCSGRGNAWIGVQAPDGQDYYSNQVNLVAQQTPGAGVQVYNNNGQMAVQLTGFPLGTTYFFCHSGIPTDYPSGGVITSHGQLNVTDPNQYWSTGLCSGRGNAWIGIQATDGADYFSNQVDLVAAQTAGASITASVSGGQVYLQVSNFPLGTTYFFCHSGAPSDYPTGGTVPNHGQFSVTSPNQSFGPLCGGSGNFWIGIQATDGADYYSNQVQS